MIPIITFPESMTSFRLESYTCPIFVEGNRVGAISLRPLTGTVAKLGFEIDEQWRGKGYASAAVKEALRWLYNTCFKTILTGVRSDNHASKAVLFKNGFRVEMTTEEADGVYYQCRLEFDWDDTAWTAYWVHDA